MKNGFIKVASATPFMRIADPAYNAERIIEMMKDAASKGVRIIVFPELSITGYTSQDLFFQRRLIESARDGLITIAEASEELDLVALVGFPHLHRGKLFNTAAVINKGEILALISKTFIPENEKRWFADSPEENVITTVGDYETVLGNKILIECDNVDNLLISAELGDDLWAPIPPSSKHAIAGASVICNLAASEEIVGREEVRKDMVKLQSSRIASAYIYANCSEGESTADNIFLGSEIIAECGDILEYSAYTYGDMIITEVDLERIAYARASRSIFKYDDSDYDIIGFSFDRVCEIVLTREYRQLPFVPSDESERSARCEKILTIQAKGLKRRIEHTGVKCVILGLSGGLDSTLALLAAVRAMDMLKRSRKDVVAISMPCFGTTKRTRSNAELLAEALGVDFAEIDISETVKSHFKDIGHDMSDLSVTFENAQARERTQLIMDLANKRNGFVVGTGDLSELALGWATFNGDHMSMYGVNGGIPKTLVRYLVKYVADTSADEVKRVLYDILDTPVSPELLPAKDGKISQQTESIVGPYELHDFFLYYMVRQGFSPDKIYRLAVRSFENVYEKEVVEKWLKTFIRRFFSQQFKRNCIPDGPKIGSVTVSPRGGWSMPSDAFSTDFMRDF